MYQGHFQRIFFAVLATITVFTATAQQVKEPPVFDSTWVKPFPPFRIVSNLYYVGTYDLTAYLIVTPKGNILINTGLASSATAIENNIATLGFKLTDIKILLNTQAHHDHMGAMAAIKEKTKARLMADEKDAPQMEDGGKSDYAMGGPFSTYQPVKPDRLLNNGDIIKLGDMKLQMLHHPGHTKGSCSFLFTVKDEQRSYRVLIANMPSIVTDSSFSAIPTYPTIAADYAYTLKAMKNLKFDIWLSSHASQCNLHDKHKPGDAYNPAAFIDQAGYDAAINELQKAYEEKLKK